MSFTRRKTPSPPHPVNEGREGPRRALLLTSLRRLPRLLIPSDGNRSHGLGLGLAPPSTEVPASPLERFWDEPQRHERIAFMMQQFERGETAGAAASAPEPAVPPPAQPVPGRAPRIRPTPTTMPADGLEPLASVRGSDEDGRMLAAGQCQVSKSPSPGFRPGLEIDAELEVDDEDAPDEMFDLEAIKIATRIK